MEFHQICNRQKRKAYQEILSNHKARRYGVFYKIFDALIITNYAGFLSNSNFSARLKPIPVSVLFFWFKRL